MKFLNRNHLKYLAVVAMLMDHIAHYFSFLFSNPVYIAFRFTGRLTAPIMCFFLAEGFVHTTSRKKYFLRLLVFAIISQAAFDFAHKHSILELDLSMIYTLLCSFCMLWTMEYFEHIILKVISVIFFVLIASFGDWSIYAPLWVLGFYLARKNIHLQALSFILIAGYYVSKYAIGYMGTRNETAIISLFGVFVFIPLLYLYNGKGGKKNAFNKWFFYLIYPLHLFIIGCIRFMI